AALFAVLLLSLEEDRWRSGAAAMSASLLCRWNLPLPIAGALALRALERPRLKRHWWIAVGLALTASLVAFALVYRRAVGLPGSRSLGFLAWMLRSQYESQRLAEPSWAYGKAFPASCGVACLPFVFGVALAFRKRLDPYRRHAALLAIYVLVMSFGVGHKESRYLFPLLPVFYVLATLGLQQAQARWRFAVAATLALAAPAAAWEWSRFGDP